MPDSETIEFRLLNTRLPTSFGCDRWGALVYAGEDGSFISYSARGFDHIWTRLRQTRNDTKYWRVSIPCTTGIGRDAQLLMAHAFSKVPYSGGAEAMHLDTDHDNNESDNIRFGNDQSNQAIANDAVNKRRNDYWRAQIMVEKELGMPITLPAINDFETKPLLRSGHAIERVDYQLKWFIRGARHSVKDAMPEKTKLALGPGEEWWTDGMLCTKPGRDWSEPTDERFEFAGRWFAHRLVWKRFWMPFRRRFVDDLYSELRYPPFKIRW